MDPFVYLSLLTDAFSNMRNTHTHIHTQRQELDYWNEGQVHFEFSRCFRLLSKIAATMYESSFQH